MSQAVSAWHAFVFHPRAVCLWKRFSPLRVLNGELELGRCESRSSETPSQPLNAHWWVQLLCTLLSSLFEYCYQRADLCRIEHDIVKIFRKQWFTLFRLVLNSFFHGIIESPGLEKTSLIPKSNPFPPHHVPQCHISTLLEHLQGWWWLHHLPGLLCQCITALSE